MSAEEWSHRQAVGWQRAENGLIALSVFIGLIASGQPWWLPIIAFLIFDLSAVGYLFNQRVGAFFYNLVHNYAPPAVLLSVWSVLHLGHIETDWMATIAACWSFHIAVDRGLGYGLKLGPFAQTHLGIISKEQETIK